MQNSHFPSLCLVKKKAKRIYFKDAVLLTKIGNKIREVRITNNMTIETLANDCGVDYSQIHRMEVGKVNFSISYLYKIADSLKVDPKTLLP